MMMLASPISSRPIRWCTPSRASGHVVARFVDDPLQRANRQRLVGFVFEEADRRPWLWSRTRPANDAIAPSPVRRRARNRRAVKRLQVRAGREVTATSGHRFKYTDAGLIGRDRADRLDARQK